MCKSAGYALERGVKGRGDGKELDVGRLDVARTAHSASARRLLVRTNARNINAHVHEARVEDNGRRKGVVDEELAHPEGCGVEGNVKSGLTDRERVVEGHSRPK